MNDFTRFPDTISSVTNDSKLYWYARLTKEIELVIDNQKVSSKELPRPPTHHSTISSSKPITSSPFIP